MKAGTFEFFSLYPTAAENDRAGADTGKENAQKINNSSGDLANCSRQSSAKKHKRRSTLSATDTGDNSKVTSTPLVSKKKSKASTPVGVESILKSAKAEKSILQRSASAEMNDSFVAAEKPKKRNKSVSFVLDDGEVAVKKIKQSSDTPSRSKEETKGETEELSEAKVRKMKNKKKKRRNSETVQPPDAASVSSEEPTKKRNKKQKTAENIAKNLENLTIGDNASTLAGLLDGMKVVDKHKKKRNKKKNKAAVDAGSSADTNKEGPIAGVDEETSPTANGEKKKKFKKNVEPNEKDENTQDNEKVHRKNKKKRKRRVSSNETAAAEDGSAESEKERVKWSKRKWNKDRKGEFSGEELLTTVIVENLPLSLILSYKKLLAEHFSKYGIIKKIGIVEVYPTEEPRPVFTTSLQFYSDGAATQALEEDNMRLEGGRISVKRPLPPTETTVAVRCYRGCSQEQMSSIFGPCGKIRSIREIQKGRSSIPTAFVEFDGPDAVERAMKVAEEAKIGGKKVTVQRFENRAKGSKRKRKGSESKESESKESERESDQEVDSS